MKIEISKDIEKYKESVFKGLTIRELVHSVLALAIGAGIIIMTYKQIGIMASAYVAIPAVVLIGLGGFYTYNGMNVYEKIGLQLHFLFRNKELTYESTEDPDNIKKIRGGIKNGIIFKRYR